MEASRVHSELVRVGEEWTIADDGLSRNGTYVNGQRLGGRRRLRDGDIVRFGTTEALFRVPGPVILEETKPPVSTHPPPSLSPAQRRVLVALARPFTGDVEHAVPASNRQIAEELVVTVDAVKANLRALFEKFDVEDLPQNRKRARLVELAFSSGAITRRELSLINRSATAMCLARRASAGRAPVRTLAGARTGSLAHRDARDRPRHFGGLSY